MASIMRQASGVLSDTFTTPLVLNFQPLASRFNETQETLSLGIGQITLVEARRFREAKLIDFDPTFENIQDPSNSIQLMTAKLKEVDQRIEILSAERNLPVNQSDHLKLLMIGQNEGAGPVDRYFGCSGNWSCVFEGEIGERLKRQILKMEQEVADLQKRGWPKIEGQ